VKALLERVTTAAPRTKLFAASGLVVLLALAAPRGGLSAAGLARMLLGLAALAAAAWWLARTRARGPAFRIEEPLQVLSRRGLSPRCAVALVEAEGHRFLVTYGEGFAQVQPMAPRRRIRSARTRRAAPAQGVLQ
jgi:flagellar protein FliO/FliZ